MKRIKIEKAVLINCLKRNWLTVEETAKKLNVSKRHIYDELHRYGIKGAGDLRKRG